jgi:hypothetical protein
MARPVTRLSEVAHRRWAATVRALLRHYKLQMRDVKTDNYRSLERALALREPLSGRKARELSYALLGTLTPLCNSRREFHENVGLFNFIWTDTDLRSRLRSRLPRAPLPAFAACIFNTNDTAFILTEALLDAGVLAASQAKRVETTLADLLSMNRKDCAFSFLDEYTYRIEELHAKGATVLTFDEFVRIEFGGERYLCIVPTDYEQWHEAYENAPGSTQTEKLLNFLKWRDRKLKEPACPCDLCTGKLAELIESLGTNE